MIKSKLFRNAVAVGAAATMVLSTVSPVFASSSTADIYAKFCKDGKGSGTVSMMQKAVDGACTVESIGDGTSEVTIPVEEFTHSMMGFSGQGKLTGLVVNGEAYAVESLGDTDGDGLDNGTVTIVLSDDKIKSDESVYTDVEAKYTITMGSIPSNMSSDADLYFSTTLAEYN